LGCIYDSLVGVEADGVVEAVGLSADVFEEVFELFGVGILL